MVEDRQVQVPESDITGQQLASSPKTAYYSHTSTTKHDQTHLSSVLHAPSPCSDIAQQDQDQLSVELHEDTTSTIQPDIEHVYVEDDPRSWSSSKKNINLTLVALATLAPSCAVYIYNTAFNDIKSQLHATDSHIALSLSMFIFVQGAAPLLWSAIGEIYGRKIVYLIALSMYTVGNIGAATSQTIVVLIVMRILQAGGAAAAFTLGSGVIADMYEPHERGTRVGIFFAIPMLGPSIGPIIGGLLVQYFDWRATFWFLTILGGLSLLSFIFFIETFRKERSQAYQTAVKRAQRLEEDIVDNPELGVSANKNNEAGQWNDLEKATTVESSPVAPQEIKLSLADVNPIGPSWIVLRQRTNIMILYISGMFFAFVYGLCYATARTFARGDYSFKPVVVGAILLTYGVGNIFGSVLGGRWSDKVLARLKAQQGGNSNPEMRLEGTIIALVVLPWAVLAYGWMCHYYVHVAGPLVMLFIIGFTSIWAYSASLAYIVDANVGRASSAVAVNSLVRGITGLISAEITDPMQDHIGDGGMYSFWAGVMFTLLGSMIILIRRGGQWRIDDESKRAARRAQHFTEQPRKEI